MLSHQICLISSSAPLSDFYCKLIIQNSAQKLRNKCFFKKTNLDKNNLNHFLKDSLSDNFLYNSLCNRGTELNNGVGHNKNSILRHNSLHNRIIEKKTSSSDLTKNAISELPRRPSLGKHQS